MTLGDSTFRPLLTEDMIGAWELEQVHYDAPKVPGSLDVLPRGFLTLQTLPRGDRRGFNRQIRPHTYDLTVQFPYPESGTLEEAKVEKVEAFLTLVTTDAGIYRGAYRYEVGDIDFETARLEDDPNEEVCSISIEFTLEWETGL